MEITITIKIDDCKVVNLKAKQTETETEESFSQYTRFFNESSAAWVKDSECNLMFLTTQQDYANSLLRSKGHLFLNEVYDMLGIPRTKAGQVVGWIYDEEYPVGDNRVDFGITNDRNSKFVNGHEKTVLLDFNVDGNILDRV